MSLVDIWSEIITILSIKRIQKKNKHSKCKTYWIKSINERHCPWKKEDENWVRKKDSPNKANQKTQLKNNQFIRQQSQENSHRENNISKIKC